MLLKFVRTAYGSTVVDGPVDSLDDAKVYADIAMDNGEADCTYTGDYFQEMPCSINVPDTRRFKCIGGPFEIDKSCIEIVHSDEDFSFIKFQATQQCIYFAPNIQDLDIASTMACVAAASDDVEQCIDIEKDHDCNRWTISAPEDIPKVALISCFKDFPTSLAQRAYISANTQQKAVREVKGA